jgi:hypothetical protein
MLWWAIQDRWCLMSFKALNLISSADGEPAANELKDSEQLVAARKARRLSHNEATHLEGVRP